MKSRWTAQNQLLSTKDHPNKEKTRLNQLVKICKYWQLTPRSHMTVSQNAFLAGQHVHVASLSWQTSPNCHLRNVISEDHCEYMNTNPALMWWSRLCVCGVWSSRLSPVIRLHQLGVLFSGRPVIFAVLLYFYLCYIKMTHFWRMGWWVFMLFHGFICVFLEFICGLFVSGVHCQ